MFKAKGRIIEIRDKRDIKYANILVLSAPIFIARVFLPSSPSISWTSLIISLDRLNKNPIIATDITLTLVGW